MCGRQFREDIDRVRDSARLVSSLVDPFVRIRLVAVLSLLVAASVLTSLGPVALKWIVDGLTGSSEGNRLPFVLLIGAYVLSQWLARSAGEIRGAVHARAERRMFRVLSERLFGHLMRLPLRYHIGRETGAVNQTLENGLQGFQMILHHLVFTALPVVVELGTMIFVLGRLAPAGFVLLFCGALVCYSVAFAYGAICVGQSAQAASAAHVDATAAMTDGILNYETVKYFTAENRVEQRVSLALCRMEEEWVRFYRRYALNGLFVAALFAGFLGASVWYAAHEVRAGDMTVGDFVLVNTYMLQLVRPVETLGYATQAVSQGAAMLGMLLALLREPTEPTRPTAIGLVTGSGTVEFERVAASFRPDQAIVKGIHFKVAPGGTIGIVGPSGAGKSTLVRLMVRLLEPDEGRILLDGVPICALPLATLRSLIAVVPQDTVLFNDTIGFNIGIGKSNPTAREIEAAARMARLHDFIMSLPDRYDCRVGERGIRLSGGERQRISIARAVIRQPRIYIFDEATASLDSSTEREILRNLEEIARDHTTIIIAHRLSTVAHADEILVLENGEMKEQGTHASLLRLNGTYARMWNAQQAGTEAA